MTEDEARAWLAERWDGDRISLLEKYVELLLAEADRQSLIARSTFNHVWSRHIVDSAQLIHLAPASKSWLDIGTGGGLPGIVLAILSDADIVLCEPRRKRCDFLRECVAALKLGRAAVVEGRVEAVGGQFEAITARAFADVDTLLDATAHLVSRETQFVLPRGRGAWDDVAKLEARWKGTFHVKRSVTDPDAGIVLISQLRS